MKKQTKPSKSIKTTIAGRDALQKAIQSEKSALETYLKFARQTKNVSGKDMFLRLCQDELGHLNILEKELDTLMTGQKWVKAKFQHSDIEEILPHLSSPKDLESSGQGTSDDLAALNLALEMEKKASTFYKREGQKAGDKNAQAMYARLTEMEEAHYNLIQAELDHIKDVGFWFGIQEFTLEANE
jgi:rubrerythrin